MWQIIYGDASRQTADVFVRWSGSGAPPTQPETIKGPYCRWADTLPATFRFRAHGEHTWKATVVDPCFWSPGYPATFRVTVGDETRDFGIRHFGRRGPHLFNDGERIVLRGLSLPTAATWAGSSPVDWRSIVTELRHAYVNFAIADFDPELALAASQIGLALAIRVQSGHDVTAAIDRFCQYAAVTFVVLPNTVETLDTSVHQAATNVLLAAEIDAGANVDRSDGGAAVPSWASTLIFNGTPSDISRLHQTGREWPRIACQSDLADNSLAPTEVRRSCELLQAQLAPELDAAGYVVSTNPARSDHTTEE